VIHSTERTPMAIRRKLLTSPASNPIAAPLTAIYARVSSDDQADRGTIQGQFDYLLPYADRNGWTILRHYSDEGVSGAMSFATRPQGRQLLADAKAGHFNRVLVYKVDRLGRDQVDSMVTDQTLRAVGIDLISATEPFDGRDAFGQFMFGNLAGLAQ